MGFYATSVLLNRLAIFAQSTACLAVLFSAPVLAAEGYFFNGAGAREKALAGAGVASSKDATAASLNPAGLANVESQLNVSASVLILKGGFSSHGSGGLDPDGHYDSNPGMNVIPNLAATWRVKWGLVDAIAFSASGNGGVSTRYNNIANGNCPLVGMTGVFCGGQLRVQLEQSFYSLAFAKEVMPGVSVGVAPIVARQAGKIDGVGAFAGFSGDPANFTNKGTDESWGVGIRSGIEVKVAPGVRIGVAGHPSISMTNFDRYQGLLADRGNFDIPATVQAGIAVDLSPNLTLMADYRRIWFNSVPSVGNPSTNFLLGNAFGAGNGAGYGVQDVDVIKFGLEWLYAPGLTLRAGYSYNTAPVTSRDADLNIMTLGVVQHHITAGLKYQLTRNLDLELAAMFAPHASVTGVELGAPGRTVEIEMTQIEFTAGLVYRF